MYVTILGWEIIQLTRQKINVNTQNNFQIKVKRLIEQKFDLVIIAQYFFLLRIFKLNLIKGTLALLFMSIISTIINTLQL